MRKFAVVLYIFISVFYINAWAGNPGKDAIDCITASTNSKSTSNLVFENRCGYKVFVVWCGELKWSKKRCGDGPRNTYYTQSANIKPYGKKYTTLKRRGGYSYAACQGSIGFGSKGIVHPASRNGSYRCVKTGR